MKNRLLCTWLYCPRYETTLWVQHCRCGGLKALWCFVPTSFALRILKNRHKINHEMWNQEKSPMRTQFLLQSFRAQGWVEGERERKTVIIWSFAYLGMWRQRECRVSAKASYLTVHLWLSAALAISVPLNVLLYWWDCKSNKSHISVISLLTTERLAKPTLWFFIGGESAVLSVWPALESAI